MQVISPRTWHYTLGVKNMFFQKTFPEEYEYTSPFLPLIMVITLIDSIFCKPLSVFCHDTNLICFNCKYLCIHTLIISFICENVMERKYHNIPVLSYVGGRPTHSREVRFSVISSLDLQEWWKDINTHEIAG